ncbi:MAG: AAA family ATPase [Thiolinea sp.]
MKGEFENRLKQIIEEVQSSEKPIILFIDEAHTLIGAGGLPAPVMLPICSNRPWRAVPCVLSLRPPGGILRNILEKTRR